MESIIQGWLIKSPPEKKSSGAFKLFSPQWRRRYFVLYAPPTVVHIPDAKTAILEYYTSNKLNNKIGSINLVDCEEILSHLISDSYKYVFGLRTLCKGQMRMYYLIAETEAEMNKWVNKLCQVLNLDENENAMERDRLASRLLSSTISLKPQLPPSNDSSTLQQLNKPNHLSSMFNSSEPNILESLTTKKTSLRTSVSSDHLNRSPRHSGTLPALPPTLPDKRKTKEEPPKPSREKKSATDLTKGIDEKLNALISDEFLYKNPSDERKGNVNHFFNQAASHFIATVVSNLDSSDNTYNTPQNASNDATIIDRTYSNSIIDANLYDDPKNEPKSLKGSRKSSRSSNGSTNGKKRVDESGMVYNGMMGFYNEPKSQKSMQKLEGEIGQALYNNQPIKDTGKEDNNNIPKHKQYYNNVYGNLTDGDEKSLLTTNDKLNTNRSKVPLPTDDTSNLNKSEQSNAITNQLTYDSPHGNLIANQPTYDSPHGNLIANQPTYDSPPSNQIVSQPTYDLPNSNLIANQPTYDSPNGNLIVNQQTRNSPHSNVLNNRVTSSNNSNDAPLPKTRDTTHLLATQQYYNNNTEYPNNYKGKVKITEPVSGRRAERIEKGKIVAVTLFKNSPKPVPAKRTTKFAVEKEKDVATSNLSHMTIKDSIRLTERTRSFSKSFTGKCNGKRSISITSIIINNFT